MVVIIGMIFLIARQPFYLLAEESGTLFLSVSLTVLIMGSAMGILWLVDYYLSEKERRRLAEDNQRMAARLHKSKEILPVLSKNLKDIKDKENVRVDGELLEEVWQLCEEQLIQDEKEALEYKFFPETGFRLLDDLIRLYGKEAAKKGIQFDLFVKDDMGKALKKQEIQRLDFLRIIGDLLRNAFHAVEKQQDTAGNILLSMGCINGVLAVDIYDNGVHFPVNILNAIGIRGNTDGGTGHGLADLFEYLEEHKVTFTLTEYDSDDMFTKGISLIWDGENGRWFDSPRTGVLEDRCILKLVETHRI